MITPQFEIIQSENDITILIQAPYAKIADTEVYVDETDFRFYSSPYYLRLTFPGPIKETELTTGKYDSDKGQFSLLVNKVNPGEHFPDLDLVSKLMMAPNKYKVAKPGIEVLCDENSILEEDDEDSEWYIEQSVASLSDSGDDEQQMFGYGFGNKTKGTLVNLQDEFNEILEIKDADHVPIQERAKCRYKKEQEDFDEEHYLADLFMSEQQETILSLLQFKPIWISNPDLRKKLTESELESLRQLGNREYLLTAPEKYAALLSLVDILFSYCYDVRTTLGEPTVESPWTINKISATLSWLQSFSSLKEVLVCCMRRSLCYPLFREWKLSCAVKDDVQHILSQGKRSILKCLLSIHNLFQKSVEPRYLLNQLYIQDYCIWLQHVSDKRITALAESLQEIVIEKCDMDFDLEELETAAKLVQMEEIEKDLCNNVSTIVLCSSSDQESSSSSSSSDSCDDSSSDSDTQVALDSDDLSDTE